MTNKEKTALLLKWLKDRPALKINIIEEEAGIPFTTITQAQKADREIPAKHWPAIISVLKKYGLKANLIKVK